MSDFEQACRLCREVARSPIEPPLLQAAGALANAARRAERREGLYEAERYYTRALDVLRDAHPGVQLDLRLRRADIMMMIGRLKEDRIRFGVLQGYQSVLLFDGTGKK